MYICYLIVNVLYLEELLTTIEVYATKMFCLNFRTISHSSYVGTPISVQTEESWLQDLSNKKKPGEQFDVLAFAGWWDDTLERAQWRQLVDAGLNPSPHANIVMTERDT